MDGIAGGVYFTWDDYRPAWAPADLESIDEERLSRREDDMAQNGPSPKRLRTGFDCERCGKAFTEKRSLARHQKYVLNCKRGEPSKKPFVCTNCPKSFTRDDVRQRHENEKHHNVKRRQRALNILPSLHMSATTRSGFRGIAPATSEPRQETSVQPCVAATSGSHDLGPGSLSSIGSSPPTSVSSISDTRTGASISPSNSSNAQHRRWSDSTDGGTSVSSSLKFSSPNTSFTTYGSDVDQLSVVAETCGSGTRPSQDEDWRSTRRISFELPSHHDVVKAGANTRPGSHGKVRICPLCSRSFGSTEEEVRTHLNRHSLSCVGQHRCDVCQIGFVHKADLTHHLISARSGSCGLEFVHSQPCTGHHPPATSGRSWDHDRAKYRVQNWEQSQLRDYSAVVTDVINDLSIGSKSDDCWSIDGAFKKSVHSLSLRFSGLDIRSTPEYMEQHVRKAYFRLRRSVSNRAPFGPDASFSVKLGKKLAKADRLGMALTEAAADGDVQKMKDLILRGAPINDAYSVGEEFAACTPLMAAVCSRNRAAVEFLLENEASANGSSSHDEATVATPLCLAASNGDLDIVKCLLEHGADINKRAQRNGGHAAAYASRNGHTDVLAMLIDKGADIHLHASVNLLEDDRINPPGPLDSANVLAIATYHDRMETASMLLGQPKVDFDYCDTSAALAMAACQGNLGMIQLLLEAHPHLCTFYALWISASQGHKATVDTFIDHQRWVKPRMALQSTKALSRAIDRGQGDLASLMLSPHEGPKDVCDLDMFACRNFESKSAYALFEQAHPTMASKEELNLATALNCAVYYNDLNAARTILNAGAKADAEVYPSSLRYLASNLSLASRLGYADMVKLLLEYGARPDANGSLSLDLVEAAIDAESVETIRTLLDTGATLLPRQDEWSCSSFNGTVQKLVRGGATSSLLALITSGLDVNQVHIEDGTNRKTTLLHIIAGCIPGEASYETTKMLLENCADPRMRVSNRTASDVIYMRWMGSSGSNEVLFMAKRMCALLDIWEKRAEFLNSRI